MTKKEHETDLEKVTFDYKIDTVGLKTVGELDRVVAEIRYYFVGTIGDISRDGTYHQRLFIQSLDISKINKDNFIPAEELTLAQIKKWLEESINPDNLVGMKKLIYEMFIPPITFVGVNFFRDENPSVDPPPTPGVNQW